MIKLLLFLVTLPLWGADFDVLMGKNTKHWSHVEQSDQKVLERYRDLYQRHEKLLAMRSGEIKIPKIVHFIWLGPRPFPPQSVENIRTWIAQNPDWTFKFWTDRPRNPPCSQMETVIFDHYPFPALGKRYSATDNWGEKSDLLRFEILNQIGGVYVDHDANCLQPFGGLHRGFDFYCCLEVPHPNVATYRITSGNGVIGSRPGHPVIQKVIELMDQRWEGLDQKYPGNDGYSKTQRVMERTYLALTLALDQAVDLPGNIDIVLPAAYFFAKKGIKPLYSQHFFANSWANLDGKDLSFEKATKQSLTKLEKKIKKMLIGCGVFLSFNLLLITLSILLSRKMRAT